MVLDGVVSYLLNVIVIKEKYITCICLTEDMDSMTPVGAPKLLEFSCQTCSKTSTADPGNTNATCLLQMKIQENATNIKENPNVSTVLLEFQRPTLDTLIEGLGRIRDQLANVANRK